MQGNAINNSINEKKVAPEQIDRYLTLSASGFAYRTSMWEVAPATGGIIWEVEGRGSGGKGVAYHTDSPTQVEDLGRYRSTFFPFLH